MLNHNKRSITIDTKKPRRAWRCSIALIKTCDVLVENFAPGALDRMGITWEHIQEINPRMIVASVKGFGPGPYEDCKVYENVAQCAGGVGIDHRLRRRPADGDRRADRRQRHRRCTWRSASSRRSTSALSSGRGQKVLAPMQDAVLNLCRVKLRDQQRLERTHTMHEYPQYPDGKFGDAVPRAGNASGGGQPGSILRVQGLGDRPQRLHLLHHAGGRLAGGVQGHRRGGLDRGRGLRHARRRACCT